MAASLRRASFPPVQRDEVERVLTGVEEAGVRYWLSGGWGVAALVGRQTREHRDLDLLVDADHVIPCLKALGEMGYRRETDWLPVRVEYVAEGRGWVDVHPVRFGADAHGRQEGLDGHHVDYPPSVWTVGELDGRAVPCISAEQQRAFHAGYDHRPEDVHDLELLDRLQT